MLKSCSLVSSNLLAELLGNNIGLNKETAMLVPDEKISDMVLGSKLAFMNWIWYMCYIWCLKGVLLCLYWKLTYVHVLVVTVVPSNYEMLTLPLPQKSRDVASDSRCWNFNLLCCYLACVRFNSCWPMHTCLSQLADSTVSGR